LAKIQPNIKKQQPSLNHFPKISIFVPCFNEENLIQQKIDNLNTLKYEDSKLDVYFLHGESTDKTRDIIEDATKETHNFHLIETRCIGKINQLNYGLLHCKGESKIIVCTDVDAILSEDVLKLFCLAFQADEKVRVVGANISPLSTIQMEDYFWRDQNIIRSLESKVYTSSIVVAPCYAFKSSFLEKFPKDCVADDVYISFKANTENYLTKYIIEAQGKETRTPNSLGEFFVHKFRKGNAYLIEMFRFFYLLPHMTGWWKIIYITKFFQLAIMPWAVPFFLLSTISLTLSSWGLFQISIFGLLALFVGFAATFLLLKRERGKYYASGESFQIPNLNLFILSNIILIAVGVSYPFYKQNSSYNKIGSENT
jgi:cellulose synthase/poly-beta-1,6-N-acetylglucosamine synthase-like glycosyltransferase